ncbi:MAG: glycosyltransferase family 2 protein [bacterium]
MSEVVLSVITPCYDESDNIPRLYSELTRVLEDLGVHYELIWVENGSRDDSFEMMKDLAEKDPRVKIIQLTRNFTYQGGIAAGMAYAQGKYLVSIDADLQDPPEMIGRMYEKAITEHYDIVYGIRRKRQEGFVQRAAYRLFYRIMRAISSVDVPLDAGDFALISRPVLNALRSLPERDRFHRGLRAWVGFNATGIEYDRGARLRGASKFSIADQFLLAFQGLFSFSFMPLRLFFYAGVGVCLAIVPLFLFYMVWRIMVPGAWPPGVATIILLLLAILGVTMFGIGLIGEYIAIIFVEVKERPTFLIKSMVNCQVREEYSCDARIDRTQRVLNKYGSRGPREHHLQM